MRSNSQHSLCQTGHSSLAPFDSFGLRAFPRAAMHGQLFLRVASSSPSPSWLASPTAAHVAPLMVFMVLTQVASELRIENSALPWFQRAPEHWVYPMQCVIVGALLWAFRRHYTLAPWRGLGMAVGFACVGIAIWIAPSMIQQVKEPSWWQECLGLVKRDEGFDPNVFASGSVAWWSTVVMRFARMALVVPFVEELFWRGFLMRFVQAGDKPFMSVPFGKHTWRTFWIVTLAVMLIHQRADWLAAFVWGALMYALAVRTKSLGACVVMHATGNLLLGLYVMKTGLWGFW